MDFIRKEIKHIDVEKDCFYVYASINDWNMDVKIFNSETGLEDYFLECWEPTESYSEMNDEEIEYWYGAAAAENWYGLPKFTCEKDG